MHTFRDNFLCIIIAGAIVILGTCAFLMSMDFLEHDKKAGTHNNDTIKHLLIIEDNNLKVQEQLIEIKQILPKRIKHDNQENSK